MEVKESKSEFGDHHTRENLPPCSPRREIYVSKQYMESFGITNTKIFLRVDHGGRFTIRNSSRSLLALHENLPPC